MYVYVYVYVCVCICGVSVIAKKCNWSVEIFAFDGTEIFLVKDYQKSHHSFAKCEHVLYTTDPLDVFSTSPLSLFYTSALVNYLW